MVKKTWHTCVKIAKITAVYIVANLLKLIVPTPEKIYILGKIHTMMTHGHIFIGVDWSFMGAIGYNAKCVNR